MSKGVETRENIVRKSAELFNARGYNGCSLHDIMEATQLKKGGIYNHFKNKDEIALAAFDYNIEKIRLKFRSRHEVDMTPTQKLLGVIDVYAELIDLPGMESGCPIFNTAMDAANSHPLLREKAIKAINSMKKYIEIKVDEGIKSGEFAENAHEFGLGSMIMMTMEGALVMSQFNGKEAIGIAVNNLKSFIKDNILK